MHIEVHTSAKSDVDRKVSRSIGRVAIRELSEELIVLLDVKDVNRELERILCIAALGHSAGLITC